MTEKKKVNLPQKGAWRKLAERLKEIGSRKPPKDLMDILNQTDVQKSEDKKIAVSINPQNELDM